MEFEWDEEKETINLSKHGVDFSEAVNAFDDPQRLIIPDQKHSQEEERLYCIGKVLDRIISVRFVIRGKRIRIIGAGCWRKQKRIYEKKNSDL